MDAIPVTLIVKAPNQQFEDQTIKCEVTWSIRKLKGYLSEVYPCKPVSTTHIVCPPVPILLMSHLHCLCHNNCLCQLLFRFVYFLIIVIIFIFFCRFTFHFRTEAKNHAYMMYVLH